MCTATFSSQIYTLSLHDALPIFDRILDKGLVIAGDIKVSLANVELRTLQIRLLVCSIDKAEQIGLNWWRYDTNLTTRAERAEAEDVELRERLSDLDLEMRKLGANVTLSNEVTHK